MSIPPITNAFRYLAHFLVISTALVYGLRPAVAQTTDSSDKQAQEAQSVSGTSPSSAQASANKQEPSAPPVICGPAHLGRCLKDIALDQAGIWTSPLRLHFGYCRLQVRPPLQSTMIRERGRNWGSIRTGSMPAIQSRRLVLLTPPSEPVAL